MRILNWWRELRRMVANYGALERKVKLLEDELRKRTTIAADIGYREHESYAIVIGTLGNRDYVQTFRLPRGMNELVSVLKDMEISGTVRKVDAPPVFRSVVQREFRI